MRGTRGNNLADKIRKQREVEKSARKARDVAYDAGLIGLGGVVVDEAVNVVLNTMPDEDEHVNVVCVSQETGREIDLNMEVQTRESAGGQMEGVMLGLTLQGVRRGLRWGTG